MDGARTGDRPCEEAQEQDRKSTKKPLSILLRRAQQRGRSFTAYSRSAPHKKQLSPMELAEGKEILKDVVSLPVGLIRSNSSERLHEDVVEYRVSRVKKPIRNKGKERRLGRRLGDQD